METGNWDFIKLNLQDTLKEIFNNRDIQNLSNYEKRKIIFNFLCDNVLYDYELLNKIKDFSEGKGSVSRNTFLELLSVINERKGICNAISQYYKLLLEEAGIMSYCVICDDGTKVRHQLNLVYDDDQKTYSFDDVTSVIVERGTKEEYFDYDLETANYFNQGNVAILKDKKWVIMPEDFISYLVGRKQTTINNLETLPNNIASAKQHLPSNFR